jgi:hypothetical protein
MDCQNFSQVVSAAGTLTASIALPQAADWLTATNPKRCRVLVVIEDGRVVWDGWIIKRRPSNSGASAEINAETLEGWLGRQEIQTDLTFTGADTFDIVRSLVSYVAGQAGGNMRLAMDTNLAGYTQSVTFAGKDSTTLTDALSKLAEVPPGFEWTITTQRVGNVFTPALTLATPTLGSGTGDGILLEFPGNVLTYDYPQDGLAAPNVLTGVGAMGGTDPLIARVEDSTGELATGVPRVPGRLQVKDETDLTRLTQRTTTALQADLADAAVPAATIRADVDPPFGSYPLGTTARLRATSPYHVAGSGGAPGLDITRRVVGWTVNPSQNTVALTLSATGVKPRRARTIGAYLVDLDRRVNQIATRM